MAGNKKYAYIYKYMYTTYTVCNEEGDAPEHLLAIYQCALCEYRPLVGCFHDQITALHVVHVGREITGGLKTTSILISY